MTGVGSRGALAPDLMKMFLAEFVSDRTPRSRSAESYGRAKAWVEEYCETHPGVLEAAAERLSPLYEAEDLAEMLPDFLEFMRTKEPGLFERPTGMY